MTNAVILLYHGVTSQKNAGVRNSTGKHIYAEDFDEQMNFIKKSCNVVSLRKLIFLLNDTAPLPRATVAVTFDDSFKNLFTNGYPVLKKYEIPATMFITTGFVGKKRIIWADKLELVLDSFTNKEKLLKSLSSIGFDKAIKLDTIEERKDALARLKNFLKTVDEKRRIAFVENLSDGLKFPLEDSENYQTLDWDEVRQMDADNLIEIGSHTVNHPILSNLNSAEIEEEIVNSKEELQEKLSHKIDLFSYPEGQDSHYNKEVIDILKRNGFICGLSAKYGDNPLGMDPFNLRRVMVGFMGISFPFRKNEKTGVSVQCA